ncbi:MAG TPA: ParB/RepB/Spo0J family partition protein [Candidatus Saccharimonadales bacterium]|nr:ParB/RepB/Spo0J family partition protein [Candidatus Saccharimonadales bacterium]
METTSTSEAVEIDIDSLQPNPLQPRGQILPETLVELAESIREHGVLEPLLIAKTPAGYQIIAGERRWRASKLAGLTKVPVMIRETSPQGMLEMAIVENVQRVDLNALERAQAYQRLLEEFNLTSSEVGQRVGKSGPYVSNTMRLLDLPDALKDGLLQNSITEGHAKALLGLEDINLMLSAYKQVLSENLGVRSTEELVRRMKSTAEVKPRTAREYEHTPQVAQYEEQIATSTGCKTKLLKSSKGGRLLLIFKTDEDLNNLYKKLVG